jgi:hypothetical protein
MQVKRGFLINRLPLCDTENKNPAYRTLVGAFDGFFGGADVAL